MRILPIALALTVLTTVALAGCLNQEDRTEALTAAERIHSFVRKQDFASIYRESSDGFKQNGDGSRFVASMEAIYQSVGTLKGAKAVAYQSTIDSNAVHKYVTLDVAEWMFQAKRLVW
jgi:hypothetical protein